jgi:hypothetical protein
MTVRRAAIIAAVLLFILLEVIGCSDGRLIL